MLPLIAPRRCPLPPPLSLSLSLANKQWDSPLVSLLYEEAQKDQP